jgi:D-beta-D-heptose 7-phosphate kinase/D-beta-D-heptose 1-phosphate adenosyltransferase
MELKSNKITSARYHKIFDYKLTKEELNKWQYKKVKEKFSNWSDPVQEKRKKYSQKKMRIAKKASKIISKIKSVKFIGVTGSIAMNNANKNSDIDLMIITRKNSLWSTRFLVYFYLFFNNFKVRKPKDKKERDRLCLNIWLDEDDLTWHEKDRNIYTAHEIAQIVPLLNKDKTHEKFLFLNRWILDYWPNSVDIKKISIKESNKANKLNLIEYLIYKFQYLYMKNKITREVVTPTRAIFHPTDWGAKVLKKLDSTLVK